MLMKIQLLMKCFLTSTTVLQPSYFQPQLLLRCFLFVSGMNSLRLAGGQSPDRVLSSLHSRRYCNVHKNIALMNPCQLIVVKSSLTQRLYRGNSLSVICRGLQSEVSWHFSEVFIPKQVANAVWG